MDRTPLILLPGLLCDAALFHAQTAALADVAAPEVVVLTEDDSMAGMARRVLERAPERFALAGLSMGGYCAQEIMRQAPERVGRLALLDTSPEADTPDRTATREAWIADARAEGRDAVIPRHVEMYLPPERLGERDLVAAVEASARNIGLDAYVRQQRAIAGRADGRGDLARIGCPTLVLCGRQDMATPLALHEAMAAAIPGARLTVIEDCAHLAPLERPDAVTSALRDWLTRDA